MSQSVENSSLQEQTAIEIQTRTHQEKNSVEIASFIQYQKLKVLLVLHTKNARAKLKLNAT